MSSYYTETPSGGPFAEMPSEFTGGDERLLRPSIMVIDDSAAVRTVIQIAFKRVGIEVSAYGDGIEAIKALTREEAPVPAVLLLDLNLPRMSGFEVATLFRNHDAFKHTILLMLTARDGVIDRVRAKMVGAQGFITKPFRVASVVQEVFGYLNMRVPTQRPQGYAE